MALALLAAASCDAAGNEEATADLPAPRRTPAARSTADQDGAALLESARRALADGRLVDARKSFEAALSATPTSVDARLGLGLVALEEGRVDEAVTTLRACVDAAPRSAAAHHDLGLAYARAGRFAAARASFARAVELEPSNGRALHGLAGCLDKLGDDGQALATAQRATEAAPDLVPAWYRYATFALRAGRRDEGRAAMLRFRRLKATGHFSAAERAREAGDAAGAIREYERALDASPALVDAHARLAELYEAQGDSERARQHAASARQLERSRP